MRAPIFALDFEGYYSDDYDIQSMGVVGYLNDERFDPYLLAIHGGPDIHGNELVWQGHPSEAPWHLFPEVWDGVAHNAAFDSKVYRRCQDLGLIPVTCNPREWYCTADLSVFLGAPRNLKEASSVLLGIEMNKEMRDYMRGKTWADAVAAGKGPALVGYAAADARGCYELWNKHSDKWPEIERQASILTRRQTERGIGVDRVKLGAGILEVEKAHQAAFAAIPWAGTKDDKGKDIKPVSALAFKAFCKANGLPVPITTEARSPEFQKWQAEHPEVTVVKAMQDYRSSNAWLMKAKTLWNRSLDGMFYFELKYFGATTGRWSAGYEDEKVDSTKFNVQNLVKGDHYGLDMRRCLVPPPGKKFIIFDYAQIEPRCLTWMTGNTKLLELLRGGMGMYEAHARATMGWKGGILKKEGGKRYDLAKARVLALGYGAGWAKLLTMCAMWKIPMEIFHDPVSKSELAEFKRYIKFVYSRDPAKMAEILAELSTDLKWTEAVNAWKTVNDYRDSNPEICDKNTGMWGNLEKNCKRAQGGTWEVKLPSGRAMHYHDIKIIGGLTGRKTMAGPRLKFWGGFLTENVTQAMARDIMAGGMIAAETAGFQSLFTVHDEILFCVDKSVNGEDIRKILITPPAWAPDIPLDVSMQEADCYDKD